MKVKFLLLVLSFCLTIGAKASDVKYDFVVDRNGRGNFRTIGEALDALKSVESDRLLTVYIHNGFYKEKLHLPADVCNVRFVGESVANTIVNYDDHANIGSMGTFRTYTFKISGNNLVFENLTIENSALQLGQAVAVHIEGDRIAFKNCRFIGNQDTIYAGNNGARQFFVDCYIEGTTDFIFGPATAWFERCDIFCKRNSYITAPNTPQYIDFGFVLNNCKVRMADDVTKVYLGRPWRPYGMTLFMNTALDAKVAPEGWDNWRNPANEQTARFMEYNNCGDGAKTAARAKWAHILNAEQIEMYTIENVLKGTDNWGQEIQTVLN